MPTLHIGPRSSEEYGPKDKRFTFIVMGDDRIWTKCGKIGFLGQFFWSYFDFIISNSLNNKSGTPQVKAQAMYYIVNHQVSHLTGTFHQEIFEALCKTYGMWGLFF